MAILFASFALTKSVVSARFFPQDQIKCNSWDSSHLCILSLLDKWLASWSTHGFVRCFPRSLDHRSSTITNLLWHVLEQGDWRNTAEISIWLLSAFRANFKWQLFRAVMGHLIMYSWQLWRRCIRKASYVSEEEKQGSPSRWNST